MREWIASRTSLRQVEVWVVIFEVRAAIANLCSEKALSLVVRRKLFRTASVGVLEERNAAW
jgi:hypothetical protein